MSKSSEADIVAQNDALAVAQPTAIIPNAQNLRLLATDMFNSRMFRGVETPAQAVAIIQMGAELGFGPVTSLNIIKIIQGQMTVAARGLLALAQNKANVSWKLLENNDKVCSIRFSRPKWDDMEVTFSLDEARAAGLLRSGGGWEKYPKDMLFARCASRGIRRIAPDAISGLYATEEIQDAAPLTPSGPPIPVVDAEPCPDAVVEPAPAPAPPVTPPPSKKTFWTGMVTLETVNGPKLCKCTDAHHEFGLLGKALGKDVYRAVLEGICPDYHKFDDIPRDMVPEVYETLRLKLGDAEDPSFDPAEFMGDGDGGK